jgi:hexosaminidase
MRILAAVFLLLAMASSGQVTPDMLLPTPQKLVVKKESFSLNEETTIVYKGYSAAEAAWLQQVIKDLSGESLKKATEAPAQNFIVLSADLPDKEETSTRDTKHIAHPSEAYTLEIDQRGIVLHGETNAGVFYGLQTLLQLFPTPNRIKTSANPWLQLFPWTVAGLRIDDSPAFVHRGYMMDCSRHFMQKDFVLRYLDLMALYKMNVFHWHLTDDQGWRIEIKKYPKLTAHGAWRTETDGKRYGGFYTQADIAEVVKRAQELHITIIPEIEMPGHALAAISSYPWLSCTQQPIDVTSEWGVFKDIYCAGNDSVFSFLENVLDEVCALFPGPYLHVGGDEAPRARWEECPKCQRRMQTEALQSEAQLQTYFMNRIGKYLEQKGKTMIGWDEILEGGIPESAVIQSWRGMEGGLHAARENHYAIMSPTSHCYFDYPLESTDAEEVYGFNPIPDSLTEQQRKYILGAEGNLWTEHAPQQRVDQQFFPRILALSEVLWNASPTKDYTAFSKRMSAQNNLLRARGVDYGFPKVPVSWAVSSGQKLEVLPVPFTPECHLQVTVNGKTTTSSSPILIDGLQTVEVKAIYQGKKYENPITRTFAHHAALGRAVELKTPYSKYYTGGGPNAITDGALGSIDFRDGCWQAIQGKDYVATVELAAPTAIDSISTRWFHYPNAWIFRPERVRYEVSADGKTWETLEATAPSAKPEDRTILIEHRTATCRSKKQYKYVRMTATNLGPCPAWHDAAGEPSWLFLDEIQVW